MWIFGGRVIQAGDLEHAKALRQQTWPATLRLAATESARGEGGREKVREEGVCGRRQAARSYRVL